MKLKIRFFGAFRSELEGAPELQLELSRIASGELRVQELRQELNRHFERSFSDPGKVKRLQRLMAESALGGRERILLDEDSVEMESEIAVLPPVCGG